MEWFQHILLTEDHASISSAIRMWNSLDEGLKKQPSISSFKHNLKITTFQKIQVPNYSAFGKNTCQYYMLELETIV